jgi:O-antigen/teichoic acid export membrane protein
MNAGIGLFRNVIIASALGPTGVGLYSIILQTTVVLHILSNLGLAVSSVYYIGQKKVRPGKVIVNAGFLNLLTFVVVGLAFLGIYPFLRTSALTGVGPDFLPLILLGALADVAWNYVQRILLALGGVVHFCLSSSLNSITWVVMNVVLFAIGHLNVQHALLTWIFSTLLALGWTSVAMVRRSGVVLELDLPLVGGLVSYGVTKNVGAILQFLNYRLDSFLLNTWVGPTQVGYYAVANQVAETLRFLPVAVQMVLFPRLAVVEQEEARHLTSRAAMWSLILGVTQSLILLTVGGMILYALYGADFLPALVPLPYLIMGIGGMMVSVPFSAYLSAQGYVLLDTLSQLVAVVFTIALDVLLIPSMGIQGAAIASLIAHMSVFCVVLTAFARVSKLGLQRTFRFERQDLDLLARSLKSVRRRLLEFLV